jgi:hypothetical protein
MARNSSSLGRRRAAATSARRGAPSAIVRALKKADGTYGAERVHGSRDGVVPEERLMDGVAQPLRHLLGL